CVAMLFILGFWLGRGEESTSDFFLGSRRIPVWAVVLSFTATEISAMTIIGVPATGFRENWQYAQFFIGSAAARVAIAFLFIPAFYRFDCVTIYEFLKHRFGPATQYSATVFFFITRLLASGVRLMAACVAVSVLLDWNIIPVILLFTAVSIVYIAFGGIKAVVWTNVFQAFTFLAAGLATLGFLYANIDGGLGAVRAIAGPAGRLDLWNWGPSWSESGWAGIFFSDPNILWIAVLNGFFGSMAAFGTDHELMQRLLTVETRRESQKTMLWTMAGSFTVLLIFLSVGTGLFVFYQQHPELALPQALDKIYPHFASQVLPSFLKGLVLSAIIMASIDSPLASLSASFVTDLYKPLIRREAPERHYMFVSRSAVVVFGLILAVIAYVFSSFDKMLWLAFKIGGVTYGSLLGVFLLGLLTRRSANRANVVSMLAMALVNLLILVLSELKIISFGWS
ncbi:MAG: sodium/solute symporter, partial [Elusimicrobiota bacterium]